MLQILSEYIKQTIGRLILHVQQSGTKQINICRFLFRNHFVKVNVYFSELNYEEIDEIVAYPVGLFLNIYRNQTC